MLKVTEFRIESLQSPLIDVDVTATGSWVGITGYAESPRRNMRETFFGTHIHFGKKSYELPKDIRFPRVRSINEETALVFGSSKTYNENNKENAWIIKSDGTLKIAFSTDNAVENIVITKDFIVVTYFDESACYGEGLEVYNFEGKLLFDYGELFGKESIEIYDCYAAALVKENQIIFCPYDKFPLVLFDIKAKTQQIWETPDIIQGFHAITMLKDKVYFYLNYKLESEGYDFGIYEWQIDSKKIKRVGEYRNAPVRGLPNGRFLARTDSGYVIISIQ